MSLHCRNCGHTESFVLLVELATTVRIAGPAEEGDGSSGRSPVECPGRDHPTDWSLHAACPECSSTDLAGDPTRLLRHLAG
ncbi:MAG: hypothetical protein ABEI99_08490 [Halobaculum sp.]